MPYVVSMTNTNTGETKEHEDHFNWDNDSSMLFQWLENNYSCDCNRSLFFYNHDESKELPCNCGEPIIIITEIKNPQGEVIYNG